MPTIISFGTFYTFCNRVGCHSKMGFSHSAESVFGLCSRSFVLKRDSGAHNRTEGFLKERVKVANSHFLARKGTVCARTFFLLRRPLKWLQEPSSALQHRSLLLPPCNTLVKSYTIISRLYCKREKAKTHTERYESLQ